ncbi:MAG: hypothetical protein AWT59_3132, partial [Candidatus Gallionella acididurans]
MRWKKTLVFLGGLLGAVCAYAGPAEDRSALI